jgi:hypothetical protein
MLLHALDKKITTKIIQNMKIQTGSNFSQNKSSRKKKGYYSFSDSYYGNVNSGNN